jgi:hypothetical protein
MKILDRHTAAVIDALTAQWNAIVTKSMTFVREDKNSYVFRHATKGLRRVSKKRLGVSEGEAAPEVVQEAFSGGRLARKLDRDRIAQMLADEKGMERARMRHAWYRRGRSDGEAAGATAQERREVSERGLEEAGAAVGGGAG